MSEEIKNEAPAQEPITSADNEVKTEATTEVNQTRIETSSTEELVNPLTGEVISPKKPKEKSSNSPYKQFKPETFVNPMTGEEEQTSIGSQVIVKKDRGLAYYVGFALLVVLSFAFFFLPGITITFAVSRLVDLNTSAAWVFSSILSFGVWLIFKMKIKGFEKSFHSYLVLCVICLVAMFAIQFITDYNIISEVIALLVGAKA
ncbi:hypothetical protein SAMN06298224_1367 [Fibrobacter sp. UWB16]|jgi:hypothetical protein|uniref:hypothetical protein n=1 Tax=unclassified Fibrobacter TaxID=2634177 RepID=UPI000B52862C|nr:MULTISPECIES: hypothetical protein [unclassified Fibrobacter]MBP5440777.1 hypothetical protein [Fibrobacter sp.]OWV22982.1 hypothetical protein B7991_02095 [Fibrobacter sp. UWB3]SOD13642.1 hypothetical protein SAMN06298224_1367 [Fibrobacter sp. UWB16]